MNEVAEPEDAALFFRLSRLITGVSSIDERLAPEFVARMRSTSASAEFGRLLTIYREIEVGGGDPEPLIRDRIIEDDKLRSVVGMVVVMWYTGDSPSEDAHPPEHHFSGVLWEIARAHPPGLSGGYYGQWAYEPDND